MIVKSGNIRLEVMVDIDSDSSLLAKYIPNVSFEKEGPTNQGIRFVEGNKGIVIVDKSHIEVSTPKINEKDILTAVSRFLEHLYFQKGQYSVHSTAFSVNGTGVLMPGRSGSGKTTVVLDMLSKNPQYRFISGDRTVVEDRQIIGGTRRINIRSSSLEEELPQLRDSLPGYMTSGTYEDISFDVAETSLMIEENRVPVGIIVHPIKADTTLKVKKLSYPADYTKLINQSFYFLEEFPRVLLGARKLVPPLTSEDEKNHVLGKIYDLVSNVESYAVMGRLGDITDWIGEACTKYES